MPVRSEHDRPLRPLEKVLISLREAAEVLSLSENTVRDIEASGLLPVVVWGRRKLFAVSDVLALPARIKERG